MNPETLLSWTFLCDFLTVCRIFLYLVPTITAIEESVTIQGRAIESGKVCRQDKVEECICCIPSLCIFDIHSVFVFSIVPKEEMIFPYLAAASSSSSCFVITQSEGGRGIVIIKSSICCREIQW